MFGMGFMEIFLIAIVAVIALGPDKLPTAMVEVAKFLKKFKSGVEDAKSTLDSELNISEIKEEANKFKAQLSDTKMSMTMDSKVNLGLDNIINDDSKEEKRNIKKTKKKKTEKTEKAEKIEEIAEIAEVKEDKV